jgi:hypothetical protein
MDVVNGCNPRLTGQYKPPICNPCPPGYECTDPTNIFLCPIGFYASADQLSCIVCDTFPCTDPGYYRPATQCQSAGLWDATGEQIHDRCVTCTSCLDGRSIDTSKDSIHAVCSSSSSDTCGLVCEGGYWISINGSTGGIICNECHKCEQGKVPLLQESCNGKRYEDVQCVDPGLVQGIYEQTSCPDFEGVYVEMLPGSTEKTGDGRVFDRAGSATSTRTHVIFEVNGWCIYSYPINGTAQTEKRKLLGVSEKLSMGTEDCSDFTVTYDKSKNFVNDTTVTVEFGLWDARDRDFVFGDITSLIYDAVKDRLFFLATTYQSAGIISNNLTRIINRHDEMMVIEDVVGCTTTSSSCLPMRAIDKSVWASKYGGSSSNKRLNEYGISHRGILDIAITNSTTIVMVQEDKSVTVLSCELSLACTLKDVFTVDTHIYDNVALSLTIYAFATIRPDQITGISNNTNCVIDRINLLTGVADHVLINACNVQTQDYVVDLQIVPSFPNWLWITRKTGVWAFDLSDVDQFVTEFDVADLLLLSNNSEILQPSAIIAVDTDAYSRGYNITFPLSGTIGTAIHMDTGKHWTPSCKPCRADRYQPHDNRTHPYCRPTLPNEVPTVDRQSVETACKEDSEIRTFVAAGRYACMCKPGFRSLNPSGIHACVKCPKGTYQPEAGSSSCYDCPQQIEAAGATSCGCSGTYYGDNNDCSMCPNGTLYLNQGTPYQLVHYTLFAEESYTLQHPVSALSHHWIYDLTSYEYTYLKGGFCSCPPGKMWVNLWYEFDPMGPYDEVACVPCPRGFYCPRNPSALNIDVFRQFYAFLQKYYNDLQYDFPLPFPLVPPIYYGQELFTGGAVLCKDWYYLITDDPTFEGTGAKSETECAQVSASFTTPNGTLESCLSFPNTKPYAARSYGTPHEACRCIRDYYVVPNQPDFQCIPCPFGYYGEKCSRSCDGYEEYWSLETKECIFCNRQSVWFNNDTGYMEEADGLHINTGCTCAAGFYIDPSFSLDYCYNPCPHEFYCLVGGGAPIACPNNFDASNNFAFRNKRKTFEECFECREGYMLDAYATRCIEGDQPPCDPGFYLPPFCHPCPMHHYCKDGFTKQRCEYLSRKYYPEITVCNDQYCDFIDYTGASSINECNNLICPEDTFNNGIYCQSCGSNLHSPMGSQSQEDCGCLPGMVRCDRNYHPDITATPPYFFECGDSMCKNCPAGSYYCPGGKLFPQNHK